MNLGDRFMRVAKANLNSLLSKVEDPEKVLEQAVEDMQRDLVKVRQSYAEVSATQKRMERQRIEANRCVSFSSVVLHVSFWAGASGVAVLGLWSRALHAWLSMSCDHQDN